MYQKHRPRGFLIDNDKIRQNNNFLFPNNSGVLKFGIFFRKSKNSVFTSVQKRKNEKSVIQLKTDISKLLNGVEYSLKSPIKGGETGNFDVLIQTFSVDI